MMRDDWAAISSTLALTVAPEQRGELLRLASRLGLRPEQLVMKAVRHYAAAIGVPAMGVDNGDEYGQRVVQHEAMVRGLGNG